MSDRRETIHPSFMFAFFPRSDTRLTRYQSNLRKSTFQNCPLAACCVRFDTLYVNLFRMLFLVLLSIIAHNHYSKRVKQSESSKKAAAKTNHFEAKWKWKFNDPHIGAVLEIWNINSGEYSEKNSNYLDRTLRLNFLKSLKAI